MYALTKFLQKMLLAIFVMSFVFVSIYVPQPYQEINQAEAQVGNSTEPTQWLNNISLLIENSYSVIGEFFQSNDWIKEYGLDALAWGIAKSIVSQMTQSIVTWINSGFRGSPAFVQDFEGFMLDVADREVGNYIQNIGALGSFVCSPFKLDIQISLANSFARGNRNGLPAGSCTLTGVMENFENFIGGDFASGGWDAWFKVVTEPQIYTPLGAEALATAGLVVKIKNTQDQEEKLLDFGGGFLSKKHCTTLPAPAGGGPPEQECRVVTPGETISASLNTHLSYGGDALIAADEIDEILGALFAQLAQAAIAGAGGLLGLSGGSGSNNSQYLNSIGVASGPGSGGAPGNGSYLGRLGREDAQNLDRIRSMITDQIALEKRYLAAAKENYLLLIAFSVDPTILDETRKASAVEAVNEIETLIPEIEETIEALEEILESLNGGTNVTIVADNFIKLKKHSEGRVNGDIVRWRQLLVLPIDVNATSTPPGGGGGGG